MTADIGKGDVVAATSYHPAQGVLQPYPVWKGDRAVVTGLHENDVVCTGCGDRGRGFYLDRFPLPSDVSWCPCGWRKIGPGREEIAALFAADLTARRPQPVREDA
jgi:hypothetical protein